MNNSVMGTSNIRYICKTGYMGYCNASAYESLPPGARYIIVDGDAGSLESRVQQLERTTALLNTNMSSLQQTIEDLELLIGNGGSINWPNNVAHNICAVINYILSNSVNNNSLNNEIIARTSADSSLEERLNNLETELERIKRNGISNETSISSLYHATDFSAQIRLDDIIENYAYILVITSDNNNNIGLNTFNTNELSIDSVLSFNINAGVINYTLSDYSNLTNGNRSSNNLYVKDILGIKVTIIQ